MTFWSRSVGLATLALGWGALAGFDPRPALAAEITDVVDAFDDEVDDPFDFHLEPTFRQRIERGTLIREANCSPDPTAPPDAFANAQRCLDEATIIFNKELDYERVVSQLDLTLQAGIWHDLEFHMTFPIIFSDARDVSFATGDGGRDVDQSNSSVDPADSFIQQDLADDGPFSTYRLFSVADVGNGPTRSGLGDISFGLAWSPFNTEREPHLATLTLGFDYIAPTAEAAMRTNQSVGSGVHRLAFSAAASRRFSIVEPYIAVGYILPLPASDSLFQDFGGGQETVGPGQRAEISGGTEFILYENAPKGQILTADVGLDFGFVAEGRDYSPIFDALGTSECNGLTAGEAGFTPGSTIYEPPASISPDAAACAWILQQPSNLRRNPALGDDAQPHETDGITTIEGYAIIGAHIGLNFQISEYVEIRLKSEFETETEHFITSSRTGQDRDGDNEVDFNDPNERNPTYNPTLDGVGNRLRAESVFNFGWNATLAFQF